MMRTPLASERIQKVDSKTGIKVIQITSYPTPSTPFPYDWPCVTNDNSRLFFYCQRSGSRDAPLDIWRCDTDGLNLFQLTEGGEGQAIARLTLDNSALYAIWKMDPKIWRIDAETGDSVVVTDLAPQFGTAHPVVGPSIMPDGRLLVGRGRGEGPIGGRSGFDWYTFDPDTGALETLPVEGTVLGLDFVRNRIVVNHDPYTLGYEPRDDGMRVFTNMNEVPMSTWTYDLDGGDEQFLSEWIYAHGTVLCGTGCIHGPGFPPNRCVWVTKPGEEPRKVAEGPYFWHSGGSFDGEWTVTDTNWPDLGLQFVHIPSGGFRTLCHAGATQDHSQFGHPHPGLSADGRICVFGSDRTGVRQVYVAHIPDEFRESVIAGELDQPNDKWI